MTSGPTISASVLQGIDDRLASGGLDAVVLGSGCGIPRQAWHDDHEEVPLGDFVRLMERAAENCQDAAFGWGAGRDFNLLSLGELGQGILEAPTVGAALITFARYLRLIQGTSELRLEVEGDTARLTYRILDPEIWPRQQDAEFSLSIFLGVMQRGLGASWRPSGISFEHRPNRPFQSCCEELGANCRFEAAHNGLTFPVGAMDCAMPASDGATWSGHRGRLDRALWDLNRQRTLSDRMEELLLARLGRAPIDQVTLARKLGLSKRSLHRKLAAEGRSYSTILRDCRLKLARRELALGRQPIVRIAQDLGYADQSAFSRAFRQHCGLSPRAYKDRH
ncbi:MAG: AraC family transcriptional regulator ligand-binding domain-containing protein [Pseudomonadota bacterium]